MSSSSNVVPFPSSETNPWVEEYQQACLTAHDPGTIRVYRQIAPTVHPMGGNTNWESRPVLSRADYHARSFTLSQGTRFTGV